MNAEFILTVVGSSAAASFITYLATRKKTTAETNSIELSSVQSVINLWKGLVDTLTKEVKQLTDEVAKLRAENYQLRQDMKHLEKVLTDKN